MPTYVYHCRRCGTDFEAFQSIVEPPLAICPAGHAGVERVISGGAGFLFRGPGFYSTDYRSADYRARARRESGQAAAPVTGGEEDSA